MSNGDSDSGTWRKALISGTVMAAIFTVFGGLYTNCQLEKQKADLAQQLEKFKVELQNKNAQLEAARASYSSLDERINEFEVALSRYVAAVASASQNPGSRDLTLTARQWYDDLSDRMGDVLEAVGGLGIDRSLSAEVDKFLKPISTNLETVQRSPHMNPSAVQQYEKSWKPAIEDAKVKIHEAKNKLNTL